MSGLAKFARKNCLFHH